MKLSDYVFSFIADQGVKHVFFLPGGGAMHLVDSLGRNERLEAVCTLHEQAAAVAAEAYARVTGGLGVTLVTTGPGGTNTITGVAAAWQDSTPTLFISGQVKRPDLIGDSGLRQLGVQEISIVDVVRPITKYAATVMDPDAIRYHLEKALALAFSGRPGPVWIDIPLDVQAAVIDPEVCPGFDASELGQRIPTALVREKAAKAVGLIENSERPVLLAGNGVRLAGAIGEFHELAELLGIPVLLSPLGIDLLPDDHPLFCGRPGSLAPRGANFTLQNSDWLLVLGSRLDMAMIAYDPANFARGAHKVMVDADPAEIRKMGAAIELPVCADAGVFIPEFARQSRGAKRKDRSRWLARCRDWKAKYPAVLPEYRSHRQGTVNTYYFSEVLAEELTGDDVIVSGSSGVSIEIFLLVFKVKSGQRVFHNRGTGAMGLALPASIGACLASGRRRTVCVDGDGGFQMNIQELATLARLDLPTKFFVCNNQGYGSIRQMQRGYFGGHLVGCDKDSGLALPDILKIAAVYGIHTARIEDHTDLRTQIRKVLETPGPVICEVMVTPDEVRAPRVSSAQRPDGSMVSKPLEDLWPFLDRKEFLANMIVPPVDENATPQAIPAERRMPPAETADCRTLPAHLDQLPDPITAVVLDFDGVFTDNRVLVFQDGTEAVLCDRGDGWGIASLRKLGMPLLVLSTERNSVVKARCDKLQIPCLQGVDDKLSALRDWAAEKGIDLSQVIYVGNDANDLDCLAAVGCGVAVQDARPEVLSAARIVLSSCGGRGALRELAGLIQHKLGSAADA